MKNRSVLFLVALSLITGAFLCSCKNREPEESSVPEEPSSESSQAESSVAEISEKTENSEESSGLVIDLEEVFSSTVQDESSKDESSEEPTDYEYITNENADGAEKGDGGITITKYNGSDSKLKIPDKINGLNVTALGKSAFEGNTFLTSIVIPADVVTIYESCFYGCEMLKDVKFADNSKLSTICKDAFFDTGITRFTVPENCRSVTTSFDCCYDLKDIYILGKETSFAPVSVPIDTTIHYYKGSKASTQLSLIHGGYKNIEYLS